MKQTTPRQQKEKPRRNWGMQILFAILLLICGTLGANVISKMVKQGRETQAYRDQYATYAEMLAQENLRAESLEMRMETLSARLYAHYDTILSQSGNEKLQASWLQARTLAGLTEVTGSGIEVTMLDAKVVSAHDSSTIIHDHDVLYVVDTLRALGAVAISINGERIVPTSMIVCNGPSIKINRKFCPVPIVLTAAGDADTMAAAIESDPFLLRRKVDGIRIEIEKLEQTIVPPYREIQFIEQHISLLEVVRS